MKTVCDCLVNNAHGAERFFFLQNVVFFGFPCVFWFIATVVHKSVLGRNMHFLSAITLATDWARLEISCRGRKQVYMTDYLTFVLSDGPTKFSLITTIDKRKSESLLFSYQVYFKQNDVIRYQSIFVVCKPLHHAASSGSSGFTGMEFTFLWLSSIRGWNHYVLQLSWNPTDDDVVFLASKDY